MCNNTTSYAQSSLRLLSDRDAKDYRGYAPACLFGCGAKNWTADDTIADAIKTLAAVEQAHRFSMSQRRLGVL